jgi:integrase
MRSHPSAAWSVPQQKASSDQRSKTSSMTTRALEAGVPTKVVQEVLGHSSAMVTLDIYSHVVPAMKSDATQLVADLVTTKR